MIRVIGPIARTTLLEAARSRMLWLVGILVLLCLGLAGFLQQVAIIEAPQIQGTVLAAVLRASAAFLTAAFVAMSMVREFNDKVFELMLAQPWRAIPLASARGLSSLRLSWSSPHRSVLRHHARAWPCSGSGSRAVDRSHADHSGRLNVAQTLAAES
jgi:hypothetical protein